MRHLKQVGVILLLILIPVFSHALTDEQKTRLNTELKKNWTVKEAYKTMFSGTTSTFIYLHENGYVDLNKLYLFSEKPKAMNDIDELFGTGGYYVTPLMGSIITGKKDIQMYILSRKPDMNIKDTAGKTALMYLCSYNGRFEDINRYLKSGSDITVKDNYQRNIFYHLRVSGIYSNDSIIPLALNKGVDLNTQDINGVTPLMYAVRQRQPVLVKKYLDFGAKVDTQDNTGKTALHYSVNCDTTGYLTQILLDRKANTGIQDNAGDTALMTAIDAGPLKAVKTLFSKNPELINIKNKKGVTPLDFSIEKKHLFITEFLKEQGAK